MTPFFPGSVTSDGNEIVLQRHTKLGRISAVRTICTDRAGRIRPSGHL